MPPWELLIPWRPIEIMGFGGLIKRIELQKLVMKVMAENKLDALVYPHQKRLVVPVGETQVERNGVLGSVTGFPAITVPGGFSKLPATALIGVPVGIDPWQTVE